MGLFCKTPKTDSTVFTLEEITNLILLASVADLDKLGFKANTKVEAVILKCKAHVITTETEYGIHTLCPPVTIVE
jgi:hypothetical protein